MNQTLYYKYLNCLKGTAEEEHRPAALDLAVLLDEYSKTSWLNNHHHIHSCRALNQSIVAYISDGETATPTPEGCIQLINDNLAKDKQGNSITINPNGDLAHLLAIWFDKYKLNLTRLNERFQPTELAKLIDSNKEMHNHINTVTSESKIAPVDEDNSLRRTTRGPSADDIISLGILNSESAAALRAAEMRELEQALAFPLSTSPQ
ncbi:MAG: hypothetical protein P1U40_07150 [Coxiellaceae bacterium]|nr:hypothetical protein [Coxiellaceae bacterium]